MTTSRIYAYRWPARLVSHKPFAAESYSITPSCIWQVFFRKKNEFSFLFSPFCQRAHFLCKMHNLSAFSVWKTLPRPLCRGSMDGFAADYTYYIRELLQSKPFGFASSLGEGANPLRLTPFASSPKGGAFCHLPVSTNKAPPERKDFPRPGEDVAQRQKGESGIVQR